MVTAWQVNLTSMVGEGGMFAGGGWNVQLLRFGASGSLEASGWLEAFDCLSLGAPLPTVRMKAGSGLVSAWATSLKRSTSMDRSIRRTSSGEVVRGAWATRSKRSRSSHGGPPRTLRLSTL